MEIVGYMAIEQGQDLKPFCVIENSFSHSTLPFKRDRSRTCLYVDSFLYVCIGKSKTMCCISLIFLPPLFLVYDLFFWLTHCHPPQGTDWVCLHPKQRSFNIPWVSCVCVCVSAAFLPSGGRRSTAVALGPRAQLWSAGQLIRSTWCHHLITQVCPAQAAARFGVGPGHGQEKNSVHFTGTVSQCLVFHLPHVLVKLP